MGRFIIWGEYWELSAEGVAFIDFIDQSVILPLTNLFHPRFGSLQYIGISTLVVPSLGDDVGDVVGKASLS